MPRPSRNFADSVDSSDLLLLMRLRRIAASTPNGSDADAWPALLAELARRPMDGEGRVVSWSERFVERA